MIRLWLLLVVCCGLEVNIQNPGPLVFAELKALAKELDLWDRDDGWGVFANEIYWMQCQWQACHDAPPSCQAARFPSATGAANACFNRAFREHVEARRPEATDLLEEIDFRYGVWYWVGQLDTASSPAAKRWALKQLKGIIGDDAYYSGNLPAHIPWEWYK